MHALYTSIPISSAEVVCQLTDFHLWHIRSLHRNISASIGINGYIKFVCDIGEMHGIVREEMAFRCCTTNGGIYQVLHTRRHDSGMINKF